MAWLKRKKWLGKAVVWLALDSESSMKTAHLVRVDVEGPFELDGNQ
jgi:hypothetical protein